jgi:hypothetical protein
MRKERDFGMIRLPEAATKAQYSPVVPSVVYRLVGAAAIGAGIVCEGRKSG